MIKLDPGKIDVIREQRLSKIRTEAQRRANAYITSYPEFETLTWEAQEREARGYLENNTIDTPTLTPIATARGLSVEELAGRVINKADTFRMAAATLMGIRQMLEDSIMSANTIDDILMIDWPEES